MIKIDFEFDTEHGIFRDALYLPEDHTLTDDEIEALKQERVDNWVAHITAPPPENPVIVEPPVENPDDYIDINGVRYKKV